MTQIDRPANRPGNPHFSSGPCAKRPGWSPAVLAEALVGRSHRSKGGKERLKTAIDLTREILGVPQDYRIGIVPASDTGAVEMAMWTMLGERGVDAVAWESFGAGWVTDALKQLKIDARKIEADYGKLPDLSQIDFSRDVIFTQNGTTSGVRVPNFDFIPADREGLTINDATSAAYAQPIEWSKCDVTTFSWQKVMGGEAAHGILVLSPRAVARLESYTPDRPLPKIFRMTKGGKLIEGIFKGETINTPSMICVEDYIDTLNWAKTVGGLEGLMGRANANAQVLFDFVEAHDWIENLAEDPATRSNTSVCLRIVDPAVAALSADEQEAFAKGMVSMLDKEGVAYDINAYRDAPAGLRIWAGATVETADMEALMPWIDWAFHAQKAKLADKAA